MFYESCLQRQNIVIPSINLFRSIYFNVLNYLIFNKFNQIITKSVVMA